MIGLFFLAIATEVLRYAIIFYGLLRCPLRKGKAKYLLPLFICVIACAIYVLSGMGQSSLMLLSGGLISFLSTLALFNKRFKTILVLYIPASLATVTWDNLSLELINPFHLYQTEIQEILLRQTICHGLGILYLLVLWFTLHRLGLLRQIHTGFLSKPMYLLSVGGMLITAFLTSLSRVISENIQGPKVTFFYLIVLLFSIIFQISCVFLILLLYSRENMKALNRIRQEYSEKQIGYYQSLLTQEEETRKFRHDIKNHMICIQELLDTGKLEEAREYVKEIYHDLNQITSIYDTGSDTVNAIINYYAMKGKEDNIRIQIRGYVRPEIAIPNLHLCTVISNLMSNAYEAAAKLEPAQEKLIQVEIRSGSKYLEFIVQNPTDVHRAKLDHTLSTSKKDTLNHGFGLRNVREIVTKYDGELYLTDDIDSVTVKVIMKIA